MAREGEWLVQLRCRRPHGATVGIRLGDAAMEKQGSGLGIHDQAIKAEIRGDGLCLCSLGIRRRYCLTVWDLPAHTSMPTAWQRDTRLVKLAAMPPVTLE